MKPFNMKTLVLLSLLTQVSAIHLSQMSHADTLPQSNAFTEGTVHAKMTQSQIDQLLAYVNQSQARLEQAMADAANRSESEQARIYLDAVKYVVLVSYQAHPGTELLMRVILNQALALTYGVPKADGNGFEKEGVLARSGYQAILPAILKASITLALKYVDQDRQAVKTDQLFDLPYAEMAYQRLLLSQEWMRSILEQDLAAAFGVESLEQWLSSMVSQDQQHQARFAGEITFVNQALAQVEAMIGPSQVLAGKRERYARLTIRKLIDETAKSIEAEAQRVAEEKVVEAQKVLDAERVEAQRIAKAKEVEAQRAADAKRAEMEKYSCLKAVRRNQLLPLGTKCITSKGSWFQRVRDGYSGETGWQEMTYGRILFDGIKFNMTWKDSKKYCDGKGQVFPSRDVWESFESNGIREVMRDNHSFWSSSYNGYRSSGVDVFQGDTGKIAIYLTEFYEKDPKLATRCVSIEMNK